MCVRSYCELMSRFYVMHFYLARLLLASILPCDLFTPFAHNAIAEAKCITKIDSKKHLFGVNEVFVWIDESL